MPGEIDLSPFDSLAHLLQAEPLQGQLHAIRICNLGAASHRRCLVLHYCQRRSGSPLKNITAAGQSKGLTAHVHRTVLGRPTLRRIVGAPVRVPPDLHLHRIRLLPDGFQPRAPRTVDRVDDQADGDRIPCRRRFAGRLSYGSHDVSPYKTLNERPTAPSR